MIKPGTMLIAHPNIEQGLFAKSVILITENHRRGTVGFILNKPSELKLSQVLERHGIDWTTVPNELFTGGPLNQSALIMIHTGEWYSQNTMSFTKNLSISSDNIMMEKVSMGNFPNKFRFVSGLSAWMPGQLDTEIKSQTWLTFEPNEDIIFNYTGSAQWRKAVDVCASQHVAQFF